MRRRATGALSEPWRRRCAHGGWGEVGSGRPTRGPSAGAAVLLLLLPATMIHLLLVARSGPARLLGPPPYLPGLEALWSPRALLLLLGWLGLQAALYLLPARQVAEGQELKDKSRLRYPINGFQALVLTALLVVLGLAAGLPLRALPDMLLPLAFAATLTAFVFSLLLYLKAQAAPASALAPGGKSGNPIYDFFLGRELNPRIYSFDFKYFCELRPGLIGWVLINLALLLQEAELRGSPSLAMWLVNGFQLLYVADALWNERSATTSSAGPTPRKTLSERTLRTRGWQTWRPSPRPRGGGCWCLGGGGWSATPTTSGTSSWPWPGPCPAVSAPAEGAAPAGPGPPPARPDSVETLAAPPRRAVAPAALLLHHLLHGAAGAPGGPRRAAVPAEVRPRVAGVLPARAAPHRALRLLSARAPAETPPPLHKRLQVAARFRSILGQGKAGTRRGPESPGLGGTTELSLRAGPISALLRPSPPGQPGSSSMRAPGAGGAGGTGPPHSRSSSPARAATSSAAAACAPCALAQSTARGPRAASFSLARPAGTGTFSGRGRGDLGLRQLAVCFRARPRVRASASARPACSLWGRR
uniref:Delta(14)-sterol reductase TM7SF2 n=1 Tax=Oryctolagus cuniculus TaxID=9986 RepID=A0A5F9CSE5_RABIT